MRRYVNSEEKKMKNANKVTGKYYLGFDIGTNSVGWAVTDENYNLCKFKKKLYMSF